MGPIGRTSPRPGRATRAESPVEFEVPGVRLMELDSEHEGLVTDRHEGPLLPDHLHPPHQSLPPCSSWGLRAVGHRLVEGLVERREGGGDSQETGRDVEEAVGLGLQQTSTDILGS